MRLLVLVGLAGCVVIRPPRLDERPRWRLTTDHQLDAGCVIARGLIRKSGKQGIGMTLQLKSRGDCTLRFSDARMQFSDGTRIAVSAPAAITLPGRSLLYLWWPIAFDNNAEWNAGRNLGELHVNVDVAGAVHGWSFGMEQR